MVEVTNNESHAGSSRSRGGTSTVLEHYAQRDLSDGSITESEIDDQFKEEVEVLRSELIEKIADYDDDLMMKVLEGEEVTLLQHMILAHHGKNEFGSPVLPQIIVW